LAKNDEFVGVRVSRLGEVEDMPTFIGDWDGLTCQGETQSVTDLPRSSLEHLGPKPRSGVAYRATLLDLEQEKQIFNPNDVIRNFTGAAARLHECCPAKGKLTQELTLVEVSDQVLKEVNHV
jgi:hypothetical protein